jgi:hypothetical protein
MAKLTSRRGSPGPGKDNSKKRESANRGGGLGRPETNPTAKTQQQTPQSKSSNKPGGLPAP